MAVNLKKAFFHLFQVLTSDVGSSFPQILSIHDDIHVVRKHWSLPPLLYLPVQ